LKNLRFAHAARFEGVNELESSRYPLLRGVAAPIKQGNVTLDSARPGRLTPVATRFWPPPLRPIQC